MSLRIVALLLFAVGVESFSRRRHGSDGGYSRRRMQSSQSYGGSANSCSGEFSAGPEDADVEITVGNLPASTSSKDVVLYWRAARKSTTDYDPLVNPSAAQEYSGACKAYASPGDADWNGGKVVVSQNGTAKIRVQAPATYSGWHSGSSRAPHVHFGFCEGVYARSMKLAFGPTGVYISSGCGYTSGPSGSYTILEVKSLSAATALTPSIASAVTSTTSAATTTSTAAAVTILQEDPEEKDWDALEFSPVYQCLMDQEDSVYDHFASDCVGECPGGSELKHRQCVRPSGAVVQPLVLAATWRLHLECDEKCWTQAVNITMHLVRLALADHLDVPFQEAEDVRLWKDEGAPATHAHLQVQVLTDRLDAKQGNPLLQSFLTNATFASAVMGLTVHNVETPDSAPDMGGAPKVSSVSPEKPDQYDQYYGMLEKKREPTVIAGIYIPEEVPVPAIISAAVGVILLGSVVALLLHFRRKRHQRLREAAAANMDAKVEEGKLPEDNTPVKIPVSIDAEVEEGKLSEDSIPEKTPSSIDAEVEEGKLPEGNDTAIISA